MSASEVRDLRSPDWANSWIGRESWAAQNIGGWALVQRFGIGHEELVGVADTLSNLRKLCPRYFTDDARRLMVRLVRLTMDDDPTKIYLYAPEKAHIVYYALGEGDGVIKIGTSQWAASRLTSLPKGRHSPWKLLAIEPGDEYVERYRHGQFTDHWIPNYGRGESRELFAPNPPLIAHINSLLASPTEWIKREEIDHTASRYVLDATLEAPEYHGEPGFTAEQAALRQRALVTVTAEDSAKFRGKIHRFGAFT